MTVPDPLHDTGTLSLPAQAPVPDPGEQPQAMLAWVTFRDERDLWPSRDPFPVCRVEAARLSHKLAQQAAATALQDAHQLFVDERFHARMAQLAAKAGVLHRRSAASGCFYKCLPASRAVSGDSCWRCLARKAATQSGWLRA